MGTTGTSTVGRATKGLLLAGGLAAGTVVACGDDDAEPLTRAEYIEQADAICADTMQQIVPIFESVWSDIGSVDEESDQDFVFVRFDQAIDELMPHLDRQHEQISALVPPEEERELFEELLADQQAAFDEFDELVDAAVAGDVSAREALDSSDPIEDVDRRIRAEGFEVCGSNDG